MPVPAVPADPGLAGPLTTFMVLCMFVGWYLRHGGVIVLHWGGLEMIIRRRQAGL
jgi:hypothetical protein